MKFLRLDKILSDVTADQTIPFETLLFNGGESHIKIRGDVLNQDVMIECLAMNPYAPIMILLAKDALERAGSKSIELCIPYFPYGRQDRVCNDGEPLSVRVMAEVINWASFNRVWTLDDHSDVTGALIDDWHPIDRERLLNEYLGQHEHCILIAPDAGALKKTYEIGKKFNMPVVECSKLRDVSNGEILSVSVNGDVNRLECVIIDDICDGGRSFTELGEALKACGAEELHLYVSHGIFSMGMYGLDIFETITTTTMKRSDLPMVKSLPLCIEDVVIMAEGDGWT